MRLRVVVTALCVLVAMAVPAGAITGGEPDVDEHPMVGTIFAHNPLRPDARFDVPGTWSTCTGTLVSPVVVVTAGHCVFGTGTRFGPDPALQQPTGPGYGGDDVWFNVAAIDTLDDVPPTSDFVGLAQPQLPPNLLRYQARVDLFESSEQWINGTHYTHPFYDPAEFALHDLGVIVLDEPVELPAYGELPSVGRLDELAAELGLDPQDGDVGVPLDLDLALPFAGTDEEWALPAQADERAKQQAVLRSQRAEERAERRAERAEERAERRREREEEREERREEREERRAEREEEREERRRGRAEEREERREEREERRREREEEREERREGRDDVPDTPFAFTVVGYGVTTAVPEISGGGDRRAASSALLAADVPGTEEIAPPPPGTAALFSRDVNGPVDPDDGGACFGDSGGPLFTGDTLEFTAVVSFGELDCTGPYGGYRIDQPLDLDFVRLLVALTDLGAPPSLVYPILFGQAPPPGGFVPTPR